MTACVVPGNHRIVRAAAHDRLVGGKQGFPNSYYKPWERRCQRFFEKNAENGAPAPGGLALALLMLGIFANNHHAALALDDLALFADRLHSTSIHKT